MANFFYFDNNGTKQGPYDSVQLTALAKNGSITPDTLVENESGKQTKAKNITGLFPHPVPPPITTPQPESKTDTPSPENPFINPLSAATTSCPHCGEPMTTGEKFCGSCGKIPDCDNDEYRGENTETGGFLDIEFTRFITPIYISVIWLIGIVFHVISFLASLVWIGIIANTLAQGSWQRGDHHADTIVFVFLLGLLASIILHLLSLLFYRITLEVIIVQFRIEENTRVLFKIEEYMRVMRRATVTSLFNS